MDLNELFIHRVKKLLGKRSAYWLSQECGLTQATLSRILTGKMNPSLKIIEKIAGGIGVPASSLLDSGKDETIPPDLLVLLSDQPEFVYEAVRGMLKPLRKK